MRRVHLPALRPGPVTADPTQAHHLRNVLRLAIGDAVEAFDAEGCTAVAVVTSLEPFVLQIDAVTAAPPVASVTVAAAVPKGDRADWMVEKLSEIGVARFIPLRTARSVVHPEGAGKLDRWRRIAVEAAKQSRRPGVLTIDNLCDTKSLLKNIDATTAVFFSTAQGTRPFSDSSFIIHHSSLLLIGPEGGWTADEEATFIAAGLTPAGLGRTILRVETAAVLAAGLAMLRSADS